MTDACTLKSSALSLDKFYTKPDVVKELVKDIHTYVAVDSMKDLVIEPSAGDGVWIPHYEGIVAYDIQPEDDKIIEQDFLELELDEDKPIHFVGNPPFGSCSSLAIKFIQHMCSCPVTQTISLYCLSISTNSKCKIKHLRSIFILCLKKIWQQTHSHWRRSRNG
jgi:hypothetical protein